MARIKVADLKFLLKEWNQEKISFSFMVEKLNEIAQSDKSKWIIDAKRRRKYRLYYKIKMEILLLWYDFKDFIRRFV